MADALFNEIIEKMLSDPELKSKIDAAKIEKICKLLVAGKLPNKAELAAALEGET